MDDFFAIPVVIGTLVLAVFGTIFLTMDFRHFNDIQKQCQKMGYIQNQTTRILCSVESGEK